MMKLSRRRFLGHALGASLLGATSFASYRAFNPQTPPISIDYPGMALGHAMRDQMHALPNDIPIKHVKAVIVGSGGAGLSAAWQFAKHGMHDYVLLDGPERNGNNRGEHHGNVYYPTGAHYLPLPSLESVHIEELLQDLKIFQDGQYDERALVHAPTERLYFDQHWQSAIAPHKNIQSERFFAHMHRLSLQHGSDGKRLFAMPLAASSLDEKWRELDKIVFATWLEQENYDDESLLWYADYCCRDDYGQGIHQVSAWAGLHYFCARTRLDDEHEHSHQVLTWSDGLNHLSERMRQYCRLKTCPDMASYRTLTNQAVSLNASAMHIEETDQLVKVLVYDGQQGWLWLHAQAVICAMPLYIAARVVNHISQYGFDPSVHMPEYAPWLVSNFILKGLPNEYSGTPLAWDNVAYQGQGLGYIVSTHQEFWRGQPPYTSFTAYNALNHDTPANIRHWLINSTPETIYQHAAAELESIYGVDIRRHMVQARITVRGHAMAAPTPDYLSNTGLQALQNHTGRLQFAHSDLSGYSVFEEACWWGKQKAVSVLEQWL